MAAHASMASGRVERPSGSFINDPNVRGIIYQILTALIVVVLVYFIWSNTLDNLRRANIASGFGFLSGRAGFDLGQSLIAFTSDSSYARALYVGFLNTLLVAFTGIITATIIGFIVGIGRLSHNWLIAKLSTVYVEIFRNIPPLLVIFFWYSGVLSVLPGVRESIALPFGSYLNNRGFAFPKPVFAEGFWLVLVALAAAIALSFVLRRYSLVRRMATGQGVPILWPSVAMIVAFPLIAYVVMGAPMSFDYPVAGTFNLTGGSVVGPEFMSLYLALSFYTASFIAEIVRGGIRAVPRGQSEAAEALGLRSGYTTRFVVVPQAMRIIIPPLTSQYLNLTKNSTLAIAIGYADLVSVGGTILNQSGHPIEIVAIWMVVYLSISLLTSLFMNWFNARMALVER